MIEQKKLKTEITKYLVLGLILATIIKSFELVEFFLIRTIGSPFGFYGELFIKTIFVVSLITLCSFLIGNYGKIFDIKNEALREKIIQYSVKILMFIALLIMLLAYYLLLKYS